jgi:hypothetical protein
VKTALDLMRVIADIQLPGGLELQYVEKNGVPFLRVYCDDGVCNITGEPKTWAGRKWLLSEYMTAGEIVQTAFKALMTAIEHEAREQFLYKGVAVLDPHYDIEKLVELRSRPDALEERKHAVDA